MISLRFVVSFSSRPTPTSRLRPSTPRLDIWLPVFFFLSFFFLSFFFFILLVFIYVSHTYYVTTRSRRICFRRVSFYTILFISARRPVRLCYSVKCTFPNPSPNYKTILRCIYIPLLLMYNRSLVLSFR